MVRVTERKVYRASLISIAPAWPATAFFFAIGVGLVTTGAHQQYPALNVVIGALALLLSLWLGAELATNRLVVTPAGLVHWNHLRRRALSWAEVRSFGVGRSRTPMGWPGLVIGRTDGTVLVTNVVGFTRKYPARVAGELTAWQGQLAPAALPGGRLPQGESSSAP